MHVFSKLLTIVAFLLGSGSGGTSSTGGEPERSADDGLIFLARVELIHSPVHLPPKPEHVLPSHGESEIDEEDTDETGKPLAQAYFPLDVLTLRGTSLIHKTCRSLQSTSPPPISAILRC